ncbi:MAG: hypothetical protein F6J95_029505 [Leptolyngbya sp. SIO1E4]|nr:hypothetical protein [Leptolyngbya sp. SIO1E4]
MHYKSPITVSGRMLISDSRNQSINYGFCGLDFLGVLEVEGDRKRHAIASTAATAFWGKIET